MESILALKHVEKAFDGKAVHQGIDLELYAGETLGLLGHSGTGKSVLLRSIIGLELIDAGEITYRGKRIDQLSEEKLHPVRTKISYAFQSGALFDSLSVFDNVAYPLCEHTDYTEAEIREKVHTLLRIVNLKSAAELMPSDLSGGMQKRVGLARSMALAPDILLYDEPTAGLDPVNVEMVLEIILRFKREGQSAIFVTHDIPAALKVCDRLVILKDGVVAYTGRPEDFAGTTDPFVRNFMTGERYEP